MTHGPHPGGRTERGLVLGLVLGLGGCRPESRCDAHCGAVRELTLEVEDAVRSFGAPCVRSTAPVTVDLAARCAAGVCVGALPEALEAERGVPDACLAEPPPEGASETAADTGAAELPRAGWCQWAADDVWVHGPLDSRTGALAATLPVDAVALGPAHDGATETGLSVGQSVTCALDVLGQPPDGSLEPGEGGGGEWLVRWFRYDALGVVVVAQSEALPVPLGSGVLSEVQSLVLFDPEGEPLDL